MISEEDKKVSLEKFLETLNDKEYKNFMSQSEETRNEIVSDWIMKNK